MPVPPPPAPLGTDDGSGGMTAGKWVALVLGLVLLGESRFWLTNILKFGYTLACFRFAPSVVCVAPKAVVRACNCNGAASCIRAGGAAFLVWKFWAQLVSCCGCWVGCCHVSKTVDDPDGDESLDDQVGRILQHAVD